MPSYEVKDIAEMPLAELLKLEAIVRFRSVGHPNRSRALQDTRDALRAQIKMLSQS